MPIKVLTAKLADKSAPAVKVTAGFKEDIVDLLVSFFKLNEAPSDVQVHALATSIGLEAEGLEQIIYTMFGEAVEDMDEEDEKQENFKLYSAKTKAVQSAVEELPPVEGEQESEDDFLLPMNTIEVADAADPGLDDTTVLINDGAPISTPVDDQEQLDLNDDGDLTAEEHDMEFLNDDGLDVDSQSI